ncbi:MAG: wall-associated, partial [Actinobacteria bacterium]
VVATYSYDPWGRVTSVSGSDAALAARNPLRYRAYYHDAETGLYYMPARYYDPATYRFLSVDPDAPSAGDPASLNAFVYCGNDPIGATDPSGARADLDGDGKVSVEEHKILNLRDKIAAKARSKAAASAAAQRAQQAAEARAAAMDAYYAALLGLNLVTPSIAAPVPDSVAERDYFRDAREAAALVALVAGFPPASLCITAIGFVLIGLGAAATLPVATAALFVVGAMTIGAGVLSFGIERRWW